MNRSVLKMPRSVSRPAQAGVLMSRTACPEGASGSTNPPVPAEHRKFRGNRRTGAVQNIRLFYALAAGVFLPEPPGPQASRLEAPLKFRERLPIICI